ncbi:hypothetical protein Tco_0318679 [Tanacetum coccineum]
MKKLYRVMGNGKFVEDYSQAYALFLPYLVYDHSPTLLVIPQKMERKVRSSSFFNFIATKKEFLPLVKKNGMLTSKKFSIMEAEAMCRRVTKKEIWEALVSIDDNKAPRPDGYIAKFYKAAWSVLRKEGRGFRQGDPISPYLFTIVMEMLNLILERKINQTKSNGDVNYVSVIREALEEFSDVSGLYPNLSKSVMFCSNVNEETKEAILQVVPFTIGKLPASVFFLPKAIIDGVVVKTSTRSFTTS